MFFSWAWLLLPPMPCLGAACDKRTSPTCFPAGSDRWWYQTATRVRFGIRFFTLTWRSTWLAWQGWHQYSPFSSMVVLRRSMRYSGKIPGRHSSALWMFAYAQLTDEASAFKPFGTPFHQLRGFYRTLVITHKPVREQTKCFAQVQRIAIALLVAV